MPPPGTIRVEMGALVGPPERLLRTSVVRVKGGFVGQVLNARTGEVLWQSEPQGNGDGARGEANEQASFRLDRALAALFDEDPPSADPLSLRRYYPGRHLRSA